jgi:hypothetical protein
VLSVTSFVIYASPPGTSVTDTSAGSPSSSSSSSASPSKTFFLIIVCWTGTGIGFGFSPAFGFSSSFGFGAGTAGAIGFPVDVLPFFPEVTVTELVEISVLAGFSAFFSSSSFFSYFSTSSLPPGRVTIVALASFSDDSTVFLTSSILLVSFLIFSADSSTTLASLLSVSPHVLVESSRSF